MERNMALPEDWGVFWILLSGFCIAGFAVSVLSCIGATREGAKALGSAGSQEKQSVAVNSSRSSNSSSICSSQRQHVVEQCDGSGNRGSPVGTSDDTGRGGSLEGAQNGGGGGNAAASASKNVLPPPGAAGDSRGTSEVDTGDSPRESQQPGAHTGQTRPGAGGSIDGAGAAAAASGLVKVGKGAEEEKIAVQKIFESFDNLSELLGLEKGAEENMTSEELWRVASAATKKRLQILSRDLEASRVKVDRQLRDEKRRKPGKYSVTAAAGGRRAGGGGGGAHQQSAKSRKRTGGGGGSRSPRNGGGGAVAVGAAAVAKTERVKALKVDLRALQDLHQSLDDMLNDWDGLPLGGTLAGGPVSRPEPQSVSTSTNSESTRWTAPPPPPPPAPSSIDLSLVGGLGTSAATAGGVMDSSKRVDIGAAASAAAGTAVSSGGGGGDGGGGGGPTLRGGTGAQVVSGLAGHSPGVGANGGGGNYNKRNGSSENNKTSSSNSSGGGPRVSPEGGGSSTSASSSSNSSNFRRKRSCNGGPPAASSGVSHDYSGVPSRNTPHHHPHNNTTTATATATTTNRSNVGASSAYPGASCFPPPLPRPAGACGVVQEARAFAPAQHLAVLQALLNGEEEQEDRGFQSDSDSEMEEDGPASGGGGDGLVGASPGAERVAGRGGGMRT